MHQTLTNIREQLEKIVAQLKSVIPNDEPFAIAHGQWGSPCLTRSDLVEEVQSIMDLIDSEGTDDVQQQETELNDYVRRLVFLQTNTIPNIWGNAQAGVPAFMFTLQGLRAALAPILTGESRREATAHLKRMMVSIRAMEARLKALEPRTESLALMVERIEQANTAADQLPTDLDSLAEARKQVADILQDATQNQGRVLGIREQSEQTKNQLDDVAREAKVVLRNTEAVYSAATSVGLAAAFSERSKTLSTSMWVWVGGLVVALFAGSFFGVQRVQALVELLSRPQPAAVVYPNLIVSLIAVGAPIWFAWLSTKQIGQRFRLSEDYAFKASISRAYEGYRREAARIDKDLEAQLLASALARLDELPLRLVETESHGSPWHELANSDVIKEAIRIVPGFGNQVRELASHAVEGIKSIRPGRVAQPGRPIEPSEPQA